MVLTAGPTSLPVLPLSIAKLPLPMSKGTDAGLVLGLADASVACCFLQPRDVLLTSYFTPACLFPDLRTQAHTLRRGQETSE